MEIFDIERLAFSYQFHAAQRLAGSVTVNTNENSGYGLTPVSQPGSNFGAGADAAAIELLAYGFAGCCK